MPRELVSPYTPSSKAHAPESQCSETTEDPTLLSLSSAPREATSDKPVHCRFTERRPRSLPRESQPTQHRYWTGWPFLSPRGIFPTRGSNPGFPRPRRILYQLSHQGSPMEDPAELNNKGTSKIIYFLQTAQEEAISLENSMGDMLASAGHSSARHPNISSAAPSRGGRMERGRWQELTEAHLRRQFLKSAEDCVKALEEEYEDSGVFRMSTIPWTPHASCRHFLGLKSGHRPDVKGAEPPTFFLFSKLMCYFLGCVGPSFVPLPWECGVLATGPAGKSQDPALKDFSINHSTIHPWSKGLTNHHTHTHIHTHTHTHTGTVLTHKKQNTSYTIIKLQRHSTERAKTGSKRTNLM